MRKRSKKNKGVKKRERDAAYQSSRRIFTPGSASGSAPVPTPVVPARAPPPADPPGRPPPVRPAPAPADPPGRPPPVRPAPWRVRGHDIVGPPRTWVPNFGLNPNPFTTSTVTIQELPELLPDTGGTAASSHSGPVPAVRWTDALSFVGGIFFQFASCIMFQSLSSKSHVKPYTLNPEPQLLKPNSHL